MMLGSRISASKRVGVLLMFAILALIRPSPAYAAAIAAAVLPDSRSAVVGAPVTVFATIVALGDATGCSIAPTTNLPLDFSFQTTSSTTNAVTGTPNTPANIADGAAQSFVLSFTPTAEFAQTQLSFDFSCTNAPTAPVSSVNRLLLSGSIQPTADVIAIAAVASNDGIVSLVGNGDSNAFAVAAVNVGASADVSVDVQRPDFTADVPMFACQTDPTGACTNPSAPASLPITATLSDSAATFSFFLNTNDWVRFDPERNRLRVTFSDGAGIVRGATSLALRAEPAVELDQTLTNLISAQGLRGDPTIGRDLPSIESPLAQLGMLLFFSKSLGGEFDVACASCHHPVLGGADDLSFPVGPDAIDVDVVGIGRQLNDGLPKVGRNSQTVFNTGLLDSGLFWDSRIESLGKEPGVNGASSGIRTPDSPHGVADPSAGPNLLAAQSLFPLTEPDEMRGNFEATATGAALRNRLAARIGGYGDGSGELQTNNWLQHFQAAFGDGSSTELITASNIALAIAAYQQSMIFVDSPWSRYVRGDIDAINNEEKIAALIFFRDIDDDGAGCSRCHSGDLFTDEKHHVVGVPQIGPGKGDPGADDFGRERQTGTNEDRYSYRTPSLLNVTESSPYFHSGFYGSLLQVVDHYGIPEDQFDTAVLRRTWCNLPQFSLIGNCNATTYPNAPLNSRSALDTMLELRFSDPDRTIPDLQNLPQSINVQLTAFLETLTDPCVTNRACIAPWIPTPIQAPDENQLNALDRDGAPL